MLAQAVIDFPQPLARVARKKGRNLLFCFSPGHVLFSDLFDGQSHRFLSSQYNFLGADGAGIYNWDGRVTFKGAAYFSGNEATSERSVETEGIFSFGGSGGGIYTGQCYEVYGAGIVFEGEATFVGNKGRVRSHS